MSPPRQRSGPCQGPARETSRHQRTDPSQDTATRKVLADDDCYPATFSEWDRLLRERPYTGGWPE